MSEAKNYDLKNKAEMNQIKEDHKEALIWIENKLNLEKRILVDKYEKELSDVNIKAQKYE